MNLSEPLIKAYENQVEVEKHNNLIKGFSKDDLEENEHEEHYYDQDEKIRLTASDRSEH